MLTQSPPPISGFLLAAAIVARECVLLHLADFFFIGTSVCLQSFKEAETPLQFDFGKQL